MSGLRLEPGSCRLINNSRVTNGPYQLPSLYIPGKIKTERISNTPGNMARVEK